MDPNQGTASAQYIAEQKLGTKVAIIWKNDDVYSTGIHDKFVEEAKTKGLRSFPITPSPMLPRTTSPFS